MNFMYRSFNFKPFTFNQSYLEEGNRLNEGNSSLVKKTLNSFVANERIDGSKLKEHWFPGINAQVFISHSSLDQSEAKQLAGYLKQEHKLDSFIDSCVWGYADDLLWEVDNKFCKNSDNINFTAAMSRR